MKLNESFYSNQSIIISLLKNTPSLGYITTYDDDDIPGIFDTDISSISKTNSTYHIRKAFFNLLKLYEYFIKNIGKRQMVVNTKLDLLRSINSYLNNIRTLGIKDQLIPNLKNIITTVDNINKCYKQLIKELYIFGEGNANIPYKNLHIPTIPKLLETENKKFEKVTYSDIENMSEDEFNSYLYICVNDNGSISYIIDTIHGKDYGDYYTYYFHKIPERLKKEYLNMVHLLEDTTKMIPIKIQDYTLTIPFLNDYDLLHDLSYLASEIFNGMKMGEDEDKYDTVLYIMSSYKTIYKVDILDNQKDVSIHKNAALPIQLETNNIKDYLIIHELNDSKIEIYKLISVYEDFPDITELLNELAIDIQNYLNTIMSEIINKPGILTDKSNFNLMLILNRIVLLYETQMTPLLNSNIRINKRNPQLLIKRLKKVITCFEQLTTAVKNIIL